MKDIKEIEKIIPYKKHIFGNTYGTDMVVGTKRGSIVFSNYEDGYEHVSFSPYSGKMPSWEDMCALKDIFWNDDEEVYQMHPPKNEYVNMMGNCLHLWRPSNGKRLNDLLEVD